MRESIQSGTGLSSSKICPYGFPMLMAGHRINLGQEAHMKPELFQRWYDPECAKVREYIEKNNLSSQVEFVDIDEDDFGSSELISLRGSDEVPCLVIDDVTIVGSGKIIDYLSDHLLGRGDAVIT